MQRATRFTFCLTLMAVLAVTMGTAAFAQDDKDKAAPPPAAPPPAAPAPTPAAAPAPPPAAPAAPAPAAAPVAPMVESIKIIFDDKAKINGQLVFVFTPEGGAAKTITVTIAAKMDRRDVARSAETELSVALGAGYKVDKYDPDKIKIKMTGKEPKKFSLTIASMTANGLSVRLL
jgi:hypothetical protein